MHIKDMFGTEIYRLKMWHTLPTMISIEKEAQIRSDTRTV
jgi:hypothetical protein